ncbi:MAG: hypothetical protein MJH10_09815 [Epibacterium sp.]|nr:hypothetical protein [Epibacterium sp.]NQX73832.1 hypothetical protein [Epibacterium sp.]
MRSGELDHHRKVVLMSTRRFIRRQSQLVVWGVGVMALLIAGFIYFLSTLPPHDPMTSFTRIECRMGGATIAEGYAERDGVYRQTVYTDDQLKRTITLIPGTYCDRSLETLRRSELPQYLREK